MPAPSGTVFVKVSPFTKTVAGCGVVFDHAVGCNEEVDCSVPSPPEAGHEITMLLPESVTVIFGAIYPGFLMMVYTVV